MRTQIKRAILATVMLLTVGQVYAAPSKKTSSLAPLVQKALKSGEEALLPGPLARLVDLEEMACQHFYVPASSAADGAHHQFHLLVEESSAPKKLIPRFAVFDSQVDKDGLTDGYYFRADFDGVLRSVARVVGKTDDKGEIIKGSGVVSHPPLDSPEVRALFQHELDFWLKNAYRKPSKPKKPAP